MTTESQQKRSSADAGLPAGWRCVPLNSVAEVRFSNVDKKTNHGELPVRLCNYMDVYSNDYIVRGMPFMHASATKSEIARFGLQQGDVIITKDSETPDDIGISAVVDEATPDLVCGYHLALIRPNRDDVDPTFLAKQLSHHDTARFFGCRATGSTRFGLANSTVESTPLLLPSLKAQQAISSVTRQIDRAIQQTEALIAKYQRIKTGLMQNLLTCGIDEHGRLRAPATHKFKPSPLGPIPKEWDLVAVEKAGGVKLGRQRSPAHHSGTHMMPYLRVANVFDGWIDYSDVLQMNFTPAEQITFGLAPGDILLNEGQSLELVGRSSIFNGPEKTYCFQNTLVRFRCNATTIPTFCQFVFKHWLDTERFQVVAKQTTSVAHLGADRFAKMLFARPDREEQKRIAAVLQSQSDCLDAEAQELAKLKRLKNGLMQDLLTGKVPVEPLLEKENHP